jgi:hypothetical protein
MPYSLIQPEKRFEPLIERFDAPRTSPVQASATFTSVERQPLPTALAGLAFDDPQPAINRRSDASASRIGGAEEMACRFRRGGGQVKLVQIHTVARRPQDSRASPLSDADLDTVAATVSASLPSLSVETYYGAKAT